MKFVYLNGSVTVVSLNNRPCSCCRFCRSRLLAFLLLVLVQVQHMLEFVADGLLIRIVGVSAIFVNVYIASATTLL